MYIVFLLPYYTYIIDQDWESTRNCGWSCRAIIPDVGGHFRYCWCIADDDHSSWCIEVPWTSASTGSGKLQWSPTSGIMIRYRRPQFRVDWKSTGRFRGESGSGHIVTDIVSMVVYTLGMFPVTRTRFHVDRKIWPLAGLCEKRSRLYGGDYVDRRRHCSRRCQEGFNSWCVPQTFWRSRSQSGGLVTSYTCSFRSCSFRFCSSSLRCATWITWCGPGGQLRLELFHQLRQPKELMYHNSIHGRRSKWYKRTRRYQYRY